MRENSLHEYNDTFLGVFILVVKTSSIYEFDIIFPSSWSLMNILWLYYFGELKSVAEVPTTQSLSSAASTV